MVSALFTGITGQTTALALLVRAIEHQRIAPAYLFAGPEGVGRRLTAERFAELLIGATKSGQDQPSAPAAAILRRRLQQRNHPDLLWVEPTYLHQGKLLTPAAARETGLKRKSPPQVRLEQVRQISQFLSRPPLEASRAVVVIEGAETMAEAAANGLLKTLEEPGQATLILLAPGVNALLPTLVSRCQTVPFLRLGRDHMAQVLTEQGQEEILNHPQLLAMAQGSPGQAIHAFQQLQVIPAEVLSGLLTPPSTLREALERGRLIAKTLDPEVQLWLADYLQHSYWQHQSPNDGTRLRQLELAKTHLRRYVQPRLVWEVTFMQMWQHRH